MSEYTKSYYAQATAVNTCVDIPIKSTVESLKKLLRDEEMRGRYQVEVKIEVENKYLWQNKSENGSKLRKAIVDTICIWHAKNEENFYNFIVGELKHLNSVNKKNFVKRNIADIKHYRGTNVTHATQGTVKVTIEQIEDEEFD